MIIKKYKAASEKDAILLAKEDLGPEAIVMNVKTIKPSGLMRLFKKTRVELTAAIDDTVEAEKKEAPKEASKETPAADSQVGTPDSLFGQAFAGKEDHFTQEAQNAIEEKINSIARLLEQQMSAAEKEEKNGEPETSDKETEKKENIKEEQKTEGKVVSLIKKQLTDAEVSEQHINEILDEISEKDEKQPIDNTLASVYQKIVLKLGKIDPIVPTEEKPKVLFFVGNTGVGKTTTIAKLASKLVIEEKMKIAIFSVDTYRIAAIDQIKTYASILKVPFEVIYTPDDMKNKLERFSEYDFVLVDTAGRSHKNEEQKKDLDAIIRSADGNEKEIFLVLSATVKYGDLLKIATSYGELFDYKIIFTKMDETTGEGSLLNLKLDTGKDLSYVTWGQNVPEDIGLVNPQVIAKKLLGGV